MLTLQPNLYDLGTSIPSLSVPEFTPMNSECARPFSFYEFFAGGGMARLGLGAAWRCLFANDFDEKKAASYRINFGGAPELVQSDVRNVSSAQLPGKATLAWASFPCQDLSLAGAGAGLGGERSGVFWPFWNLMLALQRAGRNPPIIALENVAGLITSHQGQDLTNLVSSLAAANYLVGAVLLDGSYFVAQSRPRLFIVAVDRGVELPNGIIDHFPAPIWHPSSLRAVVERMPNEARKAWLWWRLPTPKQKAPHLSDIIEDEPRGVEWHAAAETAKLLKMMSPANLEKVRTAQKAGVRQIGTIYKRTRQGQQRAEVRFDGVSGCLRTPAGGSSRQIIIVADGPQIRTRLISPRETARLMGLPESYTLPERYNDTYHLTGDGLVVPAVQWLEQHILRPLAVSYQQTPECRCVQELTHVQLPNHSLLPA